MTFYKETFCDFLNESSSGLSWRSRRFFDKRFNSYKMITRWIQRKGYGNLLIFFNGWGMDGGIADYLQSNISPGFEYDVLHCYNYRSTVLPADVLEAVAGYDQKTLVAWSLGVWAARQAGLEGVDRALAVNGTMTPVNREEGIHPHIFQATLDNYDEENRTRFMRRMCGNSAFFEAFLDVAPLRTADDQKDELASILQNVMQERINSSQSWSYTHALIGDRDTIFPPKAQKLAWRGVKCKQVSGMPHFPFFKFGNWQELCACMEV